jgi:capsular polysaccharide biosynthesis protein
MDIIEFNYLLLHGLRRRKIKQAELAKYKKTNDEVSALRRRYRLTKDAIKIFVSKYILGNLFSWPPVRIAWEFTNIMIENPKVKIKKAEIIGPNEIAKKSWKIEEKIKRKVCIPEYYGVSKERIEECESPAVMIHMLDDATIIGQTNVVIAGEKGNLVSEVYVTSDSRADLSFGYLVGIYHNQAYYADPLDCEEIDKGIDLTHPGSYNYYHFAIEVLSRIIVADNVDELRDYPILVDEVVKTIPNFMTLLDLVKREHKVIWISKNKKYHVKKLVYPSSVTWMPTNYKNEREIKTDDYAFSEKILWELKNRLESGLDLDVEQYKRIYISREDISTSRLINEKQIEMLFANAGYEIVHPERMTIYEQAKLFHSAKHIVGVTGGALTNIIFCQPGTVFSCIIPSEFNFQMYSTIANIMGLKPFFFGARIVNKSKYISQGMFYL